MIHQVRKKLYKNFIYNEFTFTYAYSDTEKKRTEMSKNIILTFSDTGGSHLSRIFWEHENQSRLISNLAYLH